MTKLKTTVFPDWVELLLMMSIPTFVCKIGGLALQVLHKKQYEKTAQSFSALIYIEIHIFVISSLHFE